MQKIILLTGSILGALSVMIGAFGAHGLRKILEAHQRIETFETAVKYQFYHTLAILFIGMLMSRISGKWLEYSAVLMFAGILIFSGSLYILSLTGITKWGAVTPFGGLLLIIAWVLLFIGILKNHI